MESIESILYLFIEPLSKNLQNLIENLNLTKPIEIDVREKYRKRRKLIEIAL